LKVRKIIFITVITVLAVAKLNAQSIVSVNPNTATAGTTFSTLVTAQAAFFQTASPPGINGTALYGNCSALTGTNVQIVDDDHVNVDFNIPSNLLNGAYEFRILTTGGLFLTLPAAVTVTGGIPATISSVTPAAIIENQLTTIIITGTNLDLFFAAGSPVVSILTNIPGILATNVTLINSTSVSADFLIPPFTPAETRTLQFSTAAGCLTLSPGITIQSAGPRQLLSVNPSQLSAGSSIAAMVSAQNLFFQSASPSGVQSIRLSGFCQNYNGTNLNIQDDDHLNVDFAPPANATNGLYDLILQSTYGTFSLASAVTVNNGVTREITTVTPNNLTASNSYTLDVTGQNLDDFLATPPVSYSLVNSAGVSITGTFNQLISANQLLLDFNLPLCMDTGYYSLKISSGVGCIQLTAGIHVSGGLSSSLLSVSPNQVHRGDSLMAIVTSQCVFFMSASPPQTAVFSNGVNSWSVNSAAITVIDSAHMQLPVIPGNMPAGFYSLTLNFLNGSTETLSPAIELIGNVISGSIYLDVDSNGIFSSGDVYLPGQQTILMPDSDFTFTSQTGNYLYGADSGSYSVQPVLQPGWVISSSPPVHNVTIVNTDTTGLDFGIHPLIPIHDPDISLSGYGVPRCGNNVQYVVSLTNRGTVPINGNIYLVHDSAQNFTSSTPSPASVNGDTIFWNYSSLGVYATISITVYLQEPQLAGDTVSMTVCVQDIDSANNVLGSDCFLLTQVIVCSYDPNDKAVNPPGVSIYGYTLMNSELDYLIRFQNTGNDTAFYVIVIDTLDNDLDASTFRVLNSSHPVETHLSHGVIVFRFENILLPDSIIDEPNSHGFVHFAIKPKSVLPDPTVISNSAGIYFDLNTVVTTNVVNNTLVNVLPGIFTPPFENHSLTAYPNPADDEITFTWDDKVRGDWQAVVMDITGKIVSQHSLKRSFFLMKRNEMKAGLYILVLYSDNNYYGSKRFILK
jgi:uncharacterized repeat protein (TIGR01451 family)